MARRLLTPFLRIVDANGDAVSGAKAYCYTTGTTTPVNVYQAASGGSAHANPVVADSGGLLAPIYVDDAALVRVYFKTSAGVAILDVDPVNPAFAVAADSITDTELAAGAAVANIGYTPVNKAGDTATDLRLAFGSTLYTDQAGTRTIPVTTLDSTTDLLETHTGGMVRHTSGSAHTWTIQPMATAGSTWVIGSAIQVRNIGAGAVTIARGSGVVLRIAGSTTDSNKTLAQWGLGLLEMEANDVWVLSGTGVS